MNNKEELAKLAESMKPAELEAVMIQKELESQKLDNNPLDTHAQLFFLYNPRFQGQLTCMSKKQLITLMNSLVGSEYNSIVDISKLSRIANQINLKGIRRVIAGTIEHPLSNDTLKLLSKKEQNLFQVFDSLLTNKYYESIKAGIKVKEQDNEAVKELEDVIKHTLDTNSKEFQKRDAVEKDAFATSNKLLASKFLMMLSMTMDFYEQNDQSND